MLDVVEAGLAVCSARILCESPDGPCEVTASVRFQTSPRQGPSQPRSSQQMEVLHEQTP